MFRSFSDLINTNSRKRKLGSQSDSSSDAGVSPAKRTRTTAISGEDQGTLLSQVSEWFTRKSSSLAGSGLVRALSPRRVLSVVKRKLSNTPASEENTVMSQKDNNQFDQRLYNQPQHAYPKQQLYPPLDVRPKTNISQSKFNESNMSPGVSGHRAPPPRVPLVSQQAYHMNAPHFDPTRPPSFSFGARPSTSGHGGHYQFHGPQAAGDANFGMARNNSTSYNQMYGRKHQRAIERNRRKLAVMEVINLEEKKKYVELVNSYRLRHPSPAPAATNSAPVLLDLTQEENQSTLVDLTKTTENAENEEISIGEGESSQSQSQEEVKSTPNSPTDECILKENSPAPMNESLISPTDECIMKENSPAPMNESLISPTDECIMKENSPAPMNESLMKELTHSKYASANWIYDLNNKPSEIQRERIEALEIEREARKQKRAEWELELAKSLRRCLALSQREPPVIEENFIEIPDSDEEEEIKDDKEFPLLSEEDESRVDKALHPNPPGQVLTEGFKLQLTRADMITLGGFNWLNDEVINFYMNMLMERGNREGQHPVYAFNTFFYPKLMQNGHSGVKRWTKRGNIDIFAKSFVLIPVHLGNHWCLAVIDFVKKEVRYYDSLGAENNACLNALKQYIEDESMDKKKQPYSTADWTLINVEDIPHQSNGSDCGVFACKFAEYISRGAEITFTHEHMPYFRRRMVLELLNKEFMA